MRVTLSDLARDLPAITRRAHDEPVTIAGEDGADLILLPAAEYDRLRSGGRRRVEIGVMDDEMFAALERAEVPAEYAYLDAELEGWDPDAPN